MEDLRGPDGLLPGEYKLIGCGVLLQPEPAPSGELARGDAASLQSTLADIDAYADVLLQTPHCASASPVNIGTALKLMLHGVRT